MDCEDPPFRWGWRGLSCVHDIQRGLHDDASDKDIFSTFDNTSRYIIIHETVMHSWNNVRVENGIIEQKQFFIEQILLELSKVEFLFKENIDFYHDRIQAINVTYYINKNSILV